MTWRDDARPVIARVIAENPGLPEKELRKKFREAYPFGEQLHWPYKIWCDEINVQLGKKQDKRPKKGVTKLAKPCAGQKNLFP